MKRSYPLPHIRFPRSLVLGTALCFWVLAGCATDPEMANQGAPSDTAPAGEVAETEATGPSETAEQAEPADSSAEIAALPPAPEEPVIDDDPDRLLGLGAQGLSVLLGEPELVRRESPAQVWQYRGLDCVFDVFLYEKNSVDQVTYVEARDNQGNKTEARACLNELLRARLES